MLMLSMLPLPVGLLCPRVLVPELEREARVGPVAGVVSVLRPERAPSPGL